MAIKRTKEAEAKAVKAVDLWRAFLEFGALAQNVNTVNLVKVIKYIIKIRLEFDVGFL